MQASHTYNTCQVLSQTVTSSNVAFHANAFKNHMWCGLAIIKCKTLEQVIAMNLPVNVESSARQY